MEFTEEDADSLVEKLRALALTEPERAALAAIVEAAAADADSVRGFATRGGAPVDVLIGKLGVLTHPDADHVWKAPAGTETSRKPT